MCNNPNCKGTCNQCQTSIFNGQGSLLPSPLCVPPCPPVVGCPEPIFSPCVWYNGPTLPCIGIYNGYNLNVVLAAIDSRICNIAPPSGVNCNIYASCSDPCPSALINKVISTTLDVTLNTGIGGCQSVSIEEKPWAFTNAPVGGGWTTGVGPGFSPARWGVRQGYPTTANLLEVRLHGQITWNSNVLPNNSLAFTLPPALAPTTIKIFTVITNAGAGFFVSLVYINTSGQVRITTIVSSACGTSCENLQAAFFYVSFDGLTYIKN